MKQKFLHICLSESWGGLEMAVSKWNDILDQHGHENLNLCTPNSPLAKDLKSRSRRLIEWDSAHYFAPDFTVKLHKLIKTEKVDVVLLQNLRDLWIVSPALWRNPHRPKLVGFAQMLTNVKKKDLLHRLVYKPLNFVMTLTDWQQKALAPYLPVPQAKYRTVPNFVDTHRFNPSWRSDDYRYQLGYKKEDFLIGVIGRIDKQKGQAELLKAFAKLSHNFTQAQLLIVGEPTLGENDQQQYFESLKKFVHEQKLEKRVRFMGFQKETQQLCANLDLFVLPSYQETFGFVVVEAMASGTPVLATEAGGVPEILGQGEYGFLCQPKSSEALRVKLEEVLTAAGTRQEKSAAALERAREFYERQKVYERFIAIVGR